MAANMLSACCKVFSRSGRVNKSLLKHGQCFCRHESKVTLEKHRVKRESVENDDQDDFFGIIRGDGVKEIEKTDKPVDPFQKYDRLMRGPDVKEKVFVTSFGTIRFDSDNLPEDNLDWRKRPKVNTDINKIEENDENFAAGRQFKETVSRRRRIGEEREFQNKETDNEQIASAGESNYMDELYFEVMDVDQTQNENKEKQDTPCNTIRSGQEGNYFDQMYFDNLKSNENIDSQSLNQSGFGNVENQQKVEEFCKESDMNYIDQIYFSKGNEGIKPNLKEIEKEINIDNLNRDGKLEIGSTEAKNYEGKRKIEQKKIKIQPKQTWENVEKVQSSESVHELNHLGDVETEQIQTKEVRIKKKIKQSKIERKQQNEETEKSELEKSSVEVVNKYKPLKTETAFEFKQKEKQQETEKESDDGHVPQQVIDIYKEPEYAVLELLTNSIIYNDNDIVAINKPYGLPCQDGPKCHHNLLKFLPDLAPHVGNNLEKLYPVHRLDANTTGVLLLAKTVEMADYLKSLFKQRKILKSYYAITRRVPDPPEGIINIPIAEGTISGRRRMVLKPDYNEVTKTFLKKSSILGQEAKTEYKVIGISDNASLVELVTRTGITHQVRVHLGFGLGCPVLGDHKYTSVTKLVPQKLPDDMLKKLNVRQSKVRDLPLHLHARTISIPEVLDGKNIFIRAELPKHFLWALQKLKLGSKRSRVN